MKKLSLKLRTFLATFAALVIFIPLTAFALEKAFVSSLTHSLLEQLRTHSLTLVSEFQFDDSNAYMPTNVHNEKLNFPESGLYALIKVDGKIIWLSESSLAEDVIPLPTEPDIGKEIFEIKEHENVEYYAYSYTAEFYENDKYVPVSFFLVQTSTGFNQEVKEFRATLWYWLGIISLILIALLLFSLNAALSPIGILISQIKKVEKGEAELLERVYPTELENLKSNINRLIKAEYSQRQRYKNSLSDLAHSLKTPLAVLLNQESLPENAKQPILQLQQIIERQLKRASTNANSVWIKPEKLAPILNQIISAMKKIYRQKELTFIIECHDQIELKMDKTDALELFGNLIDNACKAAKHKVAITVQQHNNTVVITIEDDGKGIPEAQRQEILQRGTRLDSYKEGQGIGLALVSDLLTAYGIHMTIEDSHLNGALFKLIME